MPESAVLNAQRTRMRQLVWPREHGAWGMLFVPLITGAWVGTASGGSLSRVLLFAAAAFGIFCLRTPMESILGTSPIRVANADERATVLRFALIFGTIATLSLTALFWTGRDRGLVLLGIAAALLFGAQVLVKRIGRQARMASQVIGALALTSTAPCAYYAATGRFTLVATGLWFANWIFAGNQIHFVQLRLHASRCRTWEEKFSRGWGFFLGQTIMMLALSAAWALRIVPGLVFVAFVPVFVRGMAWFLRSPQPLHLHRLGISELAHALAFGALLVISLS